eukprot:223451_1
MNNRSLKSTKDVLENMIPLKKQYSTRHQAGIHLGDIDTAPIRILSLGYTGVGLSSFMLKSVYGENDANYLPCGDFCLEVEPTALDYDTTRHYHQFEFALRNENFRISFRDLNGFAKGMHKRGRCQYKTSPQDSIQTLPNDEYKSSVTNVIKKISSKNILNIQMDESYMNKTICEALKNSNVILLFYAIDSRESFEGKYGIQNIKKYVDKNLSMLRLRKIVLLIGTKLDLNSNRTVTTEDGKQLAEDYGKIPFFEISNENREHVKSVLEQICDIYKYESDSVNYPPIEKNGIHSPLHRCSAKNICYTITEWVTGVVDYQTYLSRTEKILAKHQIYFPKHKQVWQNKMKLDMVKFISAKTVDITFEWFFKELHFQWFVNEKKKNDQDNGKLMAQIAEMLCDYPLKNGYILNTVNEEKMMDQQSVLSRTEKILAEHQIYFPKHKEKWENKVKLDMVKFIPAETLNITFELFFNELHFQWFVNEQKKNDENIGKLMTKIAKM